MHCVRPSERLACLVALVAGDRRARLLVPARRARGSRPHSRVDDLGLGAHQDLGPRLPGRRAAAALHRERLRGDLRPGQRPEPSRPLGRVTQFDANFDPTGEGGLMGIALSPGFDGSTNRRAFVCYSTTYRQPGGVLRRRTSPPAPSSRSRTGCPIVTGLPHSAHPQRLSRPLPTRTGALFVVHRRRRRPPPGRSRRRCSAGKILRIDQNGNPVAGQRVRRSGTREGTATHKASRSDRDRTTRTRSSTVPTSTTRSTSSSTGPNSGWNPNNGSGGLRPVEADDRRVDRARQHDDAGRGSRAASRSRRRAARSCRARSGRSWNGALVVACLDGSPTSASACW